MSILPISNNVYLGADIQIVGDGRGLSLLIPGQAVFGIKDIFSVSAQVNFDRDFRQLMSPGGIYKHVLVQEIKRLTLEMAFGEGTYTTGDIPLISEEQFKRLTIMDILKLLSRKQEERGKTII